MKRVNDYMELPYRMEVVEDKVEGGYVISFPELPGVYYRRGNDRSCDAECDRCEACLAGGCSRRWGTHSSARE